MERKYSEIISKYGPLFENLRYLERLNLDNTSLVREKWTTELCEDDVEVMPIILENEEYSHQDENEYDASSEVGLKFNNDLHEHDIHYLSFENEQVYSSNNSNMKQCSKDDEPPTITYFTTFGDDHLQSSNIRGPEETFASLRSLSFDSFSFNSTKTYSDDDRNAFIVTDDETEILFTKNDELSTANQKKTMCFRDDAGTSKPHFEPSLCFLEKVEACTNLLPPSESLGKYVSLHRGEAGVLDIPNELSSKKTIHGLNSGRIARPLSMKYFLEKRGETKMKHINRKNSVMDLTNRANEHNMNLSSMYDELCAANIEQKQKSNVKTSNGLNFALDLCNNNSSNVTILSSEKLYVQPDIPKPGTSGIRIGETSTEMPITDCSRISKTNKYSTTDRKQDSVISNISDDSSSGEFLPLFDKEEN
ncbi:hypothetical protein WA026_008839 [Henosepilachna vigintioctopunctata]|uniref:Uncharacterized protein n=1 Tax=Henosepilachna vigintioctopunctata TaxID=420089 RepID=A0AAW1VBD7_9CUCU